jgi:HEPN domain-containing protein
LFQSRRWYNVLSPDAQRSVCVNRADLQQLAEERIAEAEILLNAGKWSGAYYLSGYAVECALKACIAKLTKSEDFPDRKFVQDSWTHDILGLLNTAGLQAIWQADCSANPELSRRWRTARDWNERSRYEFKTEAEAKALYEAITNAIHGVLPWIKLRW